MSEEMNYKEQIVKLIKLQELDSELYDLTQEKETYPARIQEMDESLETKKDGMAQADEDLKAVQLLKSEKEMDMQTKEEKVKKHEGDLYQIKNNKEYQALQHEIDSIKADISLIEEDILELFDKIEEAQSKCRKEKRIFEEEKQQVEKVKQEIKVEEKKIDEKLSEFTNKRKELISGVDQELLAKYEQILANKGKIAIATVQGEFCSECNMQLRPQIINEAKLKKKIVSCESCARILYAED